MIAGDKIVTTQLRCNGALVPVEVVAIEKHEIRWRLHVVPRADEDWYVEYAHVVDPRTVVGRVEKRARGMTWAPAWIEDEVRRLSVVAALS